MPPSTTLPLRPAPHRPPLAVTSQQSRFHAEAKDTASTELLIKDLSLSISDNVELLAHAELHLQPAGRYVLVGRNGCGKSSLLRALAGGMIPGVKWSLRILLLGQVVEDEAEGTEEEGAGKAEEETVVQRVLNRDRGRVLASREARGDHPPPLFYISASLNGA
jgi:ATP-binding cassette subfamily F protein 3